MAIPQDPSQACEELLPAHAPSRSWRRGAQVPEMIILRKVLKAPLIATFAGVVGLGILVVGYLFNIVL